MEHKGRPQKSGRTIRQKCAGAMPGDSAGLRAGAALVILLSRLDAWLLALHYCSLCIRQARRGDLLLPLDC